MNIVNENDKNVLLGEISYPKVFYAKPIEDDKIIIQNKYTGEMFVSNVFSSISVDGTFHESALITVNELNKILSV